ncbi:PfkB family carbohydrate kinase [Spirillospora sp. NPDC029432]|uniref:PfkB family carbohydrate kinase n=1 Tax=Spirillospora sp. NPDC029432 TaxID=3154599 RepID=UPI003451BF0F
MTNTAPHDVLCVGEALIDLVPDGGLYAPRAGGAPANVAAAAAGLGRRSALISAVGADWLGDTVLGALRDARVDCTYVSRDPHRATGVAVVAPAGVQPGFLLYRSASADAHLTLTADARRAVETSRVVHISSLLAASEAGERVQQSVLGAVDRDRTLVSYDVNIRTAAWPAPEAMLTATREMLRRADIIKVTEEELRILGVTLTSAVAADALWLVTDGAAAARLVTSRFDVRVPIEAVTVVDTTGAGDATLAALLDGVLAAPSPRRIGRDDAERALRRAVSIGSYVVTQHGAMCDLRPFTA